MTRTLVRFAARIGLVVAPLVSAAVSAQGATAEAKPLLDGMAAVQTSLSALRPTLPGDGSIGEIGFDPSRGEWRFQLDRGDGQSPRTLIVTLDEATGVICAHEPASSRCVAQGSAQAELEQARARRAAIEEALRHPAPDLQEVMVALVRYQVSAKDGYLHANRTPLYVVLHWPKGDRQLELSSEAVRRLADTGLTLLPGSAWHAPDEHASTETPMRMDVQFPTRRPDGDYDVRYGFYCGALCGSWHSAVMHHDAAGWRVARSHMDAIS